MSGERIVLAGDVEGAAARLVHATELLASVGLGRHENRTVCSGPDAQALQGLPVTASIVVMAGSAGADPWGFVGLFGVHRGPRFVEDAGG